MAGAAAAGAGATATAASATVHSGDGAETLSSGQLAVDRAGAEVEVMTKGRHDPCVGIRAVPVGEAMLALVLADHLLRHRAQNPDAPTRARLPRN